MDKVLIILEESEMVTEYSSTAGIFRIPVT